MLCLHAFSISNLNSIALGWSVFIDRCGLGLRSLIFSSEDSLEAEFIFFTSVVFQYLYIWNCISSHSKTNNISILLSQSKIPNTFRESLYLFVYQKLTCVQIHGPQCRTYVRTWTMETATTSTHQFDRAAEGKRVQSRHCRSHTGQVKTS